MHLSYSRNIEKFDLLFSEYAYESSLSQARFHCFYVFREKACPSVETKKKNQV